MQRQEQRPLVLARLFLSLHRSRIDRTGRSRATFQLNFRRQQLKGLSKQSQTNVRPAWLRNQGRSMPRQTSSRQYRNRIGPLAGIRQTSGQLAAGSG